MVNAMSWHFRQLPFWSRVEAQSERSGDCLLFTGHRNEDGYGRIRKDGKLVFVHREVWIKHNGPIARGLVVMHKCDTPNCINEKHLVIGAQSENIADMVKKGRAKFAQYGNVHTKGKHINVGSAHGSAKFTEEIVRSIRLEFSADDSWCTVERLAKKYKCSNAAINHIRRRTRWKHVT